MDHTELSNFKLVLATILCGALILAAVIDFWKLKVPNWLTFPLILSGWLLGAMGAEADSLTSWTWSGWWASFVMSFLGLALLLPVYMIGGMGAGDVKMQMGFGAWIGALFGMSEGFWTVISGFCIGGLVGGVIATIMIVWRGAYGQNRRNVAEILRDLFTSASPWEMADKAAARKPRMHLLPYGVPLCIGFVSYLVFRQEIREFIAIFFP